MLDVGEDAASVHFGVLLAGAGAVDLARPRFEVVGIDVPVTRIPRGPLAAEPQGLASAQPDRDLRVPVAESDNSNWRGALSTSVQAADPLAVEAARARATATSARRETVVRATDRLIAVARKPIVGGPRRKPA